MSSDLFVCKSCGHVVIGNTNLHECPKWVVPANSGDISMLERRILEVGDKMDGRLEVIESKLKDLNDWLNAINANTSQTRDLVDDIHLDQSQIFTLLT